MAYKPYRQPRTISCHGPQYILVPKSGSNSIRQAITNSNRKSAIGGAKKFVFSFVRHPLSRLVSAYVEKVQTGKTRVICTKFMHELPTTISLADFVEWLHGFPKKGILNDHFCPQSWLLRGEKDLDFVGCLERVKEDWQVLVARGIDKLPHKHKTARVKPWHEMLDEQTERRAREFFVDDFNTWGQSFGWR